MVVSGADRHSSVISTISDLVPRRSGGPQVPAPLDVVFNDARAHLVPAHLLVRDRYGLQAPAEALRIPSLWLLAPPASADSARKHALISQAFSAVDAPKYVVWLSGAQGQQKEYTDNLSRWLNTLNAGR